MTKTVKKYKELLKCALLFLIGGALYYCIEILWRGHSHWIMAVVGGICFVVIGGLNNYIPWEMPMWEQGLVGALFVTGMELLFPAIQSAWSNLSAIYCVMVLPCFVVHLCR